MVVFLSHLPERLVFNLSGTTTPKGLQMTMGASGKIQTSPIITSICRIQFEECGMVNTLIFLEQ